jgi:N-acetylmuramoyl-L-alanine amidase
MENKMRTINNIVIHCTATSQSAKVSSILKYWNETLNWKNPGYHFLIEADGTIHNLQPVEKASNGVQGHNANSIHISYIGGIDDKGNPIDNRTPAQMRSLQEIVLAMIKKIPNAEVLGHKDFPNVNKACPCFDVKSWHKKLMEAQNPIEKEKRV